MKLDLNLGIHKSANYLVDRGEIDIISLHEPYKMKVDANGNSFYLIFGRYENGGFLCIPNWSVGCDLADFNDIFWNAESIARNLDIQNATIIAAAISEAKPYLEGGELYEKISEL